MPKRYGLPAARQRYDKKQNALKAIANLPIKPFVRAARGLEIRRNPYPVRDGAHSERFRAANMVKQLQIYSFETLRSHVMAAESCRKRFRQNHKQLCWRWPFCCFRDAWFHGTQDSLMELQ